LVQVVGGTNLYVMKGGYASTLCNATDIDQVSVFVHDRCSGNLGGGTSMKMKTFPTKVESQYFNSADCAGTPYNVVDISKDVCTISTVGGVSFSTMTVDVAPLLHGKFRLEGYYSDNADCTSNTYNVKTYKRIDSCMYDDENQHYYSSDGTQIMAYSGTVTKVGSVIQPCVKSNIPLESQTTCAGGSELTCVPNLYQSALDQV